jgi:isopenicillin-N epimerase
MDTHFLKSLFLLEPQVIFLNHGSFGACPRPVFEAYQAMQRRLENQPVRFMHSEYAVLDFQARQSLGENLHVDPNDLVFVPNATHGVNIVMRSLKLDPNDEILTTDQEYGACDNTWEFYCQKVGAQYIHQSISLPAPSEAAIVEQFWQGVTPRTKLIFLSHITSPTAYRLPIEAICQRARQAGILTLIDGAHAPGQFPLDLPAVGADFYTGNCHKWMMAPKGSAFFFARKEAQVLVEPLVVSFGWNRQGTSERSRFQDYFQWTGTRDPSAAFTVPAAIHFAQEHDWESVRPECHLLLQETIDRICQWSGEASLYSSGDSYCQMGVAPLPSGMDISVLNRYLLEDKNIVVPCTQWQGRKFLRISVQGYNTPEDLDTLVKALAHFPG